MHILNLCLTFAIFWFFHNKRVVFVEQNVMIMTQIYINFKIQNQSNFFIFEWYYDFHMFIIIFFMFIFFSQISFHTTTRIEYRIVNFRQFIRNINWRYAQINKTSSMLISNVCDTFVQQNFYHWQFLIFVVIVANVQNS